MKKHPWMILSAVVAAALPWAACGGSSGGSGGSTTTTTTHTTTTTTHTTSTTSTTTTSMGTGGSPCDGILQSGTCADCLTMSCCQELADCNNDSAGNCLDCATGNTSGAMCMAAPTAALLSSFMTCLNANCATPCPPPAPPPDPACDAPMTAPSMGACYTIPSGGCNPITNAGCTGAGASCDVGMSGFQCYPPPPPNTAALCAMCDDNTECLPGSTCVGTCAKYCCDDGDCGSGTCDKTQVGDPNVGICVKKSADAGTD